MQVQVDEARSDHRPIDGVVQLDTRDATALDRQRPAAQLTFDKQAAGQNERRF
jgi:hypothetical protein